jgi:hypothetical protein
MSYRDPTKGLRFCPICRVSTPGQAKRDTLENQIEANIRTIKFLSGTIPDYC